MKTFVYAKFCRTALLAGLMTPAAVFAGAKSNLLTNPSFESGMGVDFVDAWMEEGDHEFREEAGAFGYTLGDGTFPDGTYALKMFSGAADVYQGGISVKGDARYYLGAQFYHSSQQDVIDAGELSLRGFLRVEWFDKDHHVIREDYTPNHNGTTPADQWVTVEQVFIAPPNAATAKIHVQTDIDAGGGSIFADMVVFGEEK